MSIGKNTSFIIFLMEETEIEQSMWLFVDLFKTTDDFGLVLYYNEPRNIRNIFD